jgi:hypothetical protein
MAAHDQRRVQHQFLCALTFELTLTAEAGAVSPVTDDATTGRHRAYSACRSGSGLNEGLGLSLVQRPSLLRI